MGYNTDYELDIQCSPCGVDTVPIIAEASEMCFGLSETGECCEAVKWYDHESDMKEFSKKYPEITFELSGVGEEVLIENPDIWKKYFKNGKMQVCRASVEFDNYSIEKLR